MSTLPVIPQLHLLSPCHSRAWVGVTPWQQHKVPPHCNLVITQVGYTVKWSLTLTQTVSLTLNICSSFHRAMLLSCLKKWHAESLWMRLPRPYGLYSSKSNVTKHTQYSRVCEHTQISIGPARHIHCAMLVQWKLNCMFLYKTGLIDLLCLIVVGCQQICNRQQFIPIHWQQILGNILQYEGVRLVWPSLLPGNRWISQKGKMTYHLSIIPHYWITHCSGMLEEKLTIGCYKWTNSQVNNIII